MVPFRSTLCVLAVLSAGSLFAQAPIEPVIPTAIPAPIEPPVQVSATPILPGTTTTTTTTTNGAVIAAAPIPGAPLTPPLPGAAPGAPQVNGAHLNDFQGDPIDLVLRTLARQAKMNIVVSDQVSQTGGTVNMRIEDKTPREAIEIIVESKGLVLDESKSGVFYIKTQGEKQKEPTESGSFTLNYAQAKDVLPLLQTQLQSGVAPQADQRTNTVFFRENRSNLDKIKLFLQTIDSPTQQVMIEARLVEVTANPKQSYGINWAGVLGSSASAQTISLTGTAVTGTRTNSSTGTIGGTGVSNSTFTTTNGDPVVTTNNINSSSNNNTGTVGSAITNAFASSAGGFLRNATSFSSLGSAVGGQLAILNVPQMSVAMRFLNEDADAEFLANPRVVTANNQQAIIKITRNQPVPQLNFNEQTAQAVFSGFQDKEFGNTLTVVPSINKDDFISLMVKPEISNKVGDATFTFSGATVTSPVIDKRELNSNVLIHSGDTLAIGGLLQDEQTKGRTKVPILGDIPLLGYAFQEKLAARVKRNLLIFVTPTVIKQGYGTGLEDQVTGLAHSGEEYADPNGWRNNAKGAKRLVPTSHRQLVADYPTPGVPPAPKKVKR
ncbi:MAG: type pilus assembly protein PilQ [Chthoniobacter sp.]|jgi:type IV pilus assembly protein PilQ|nr:type pilus assembly protein PilQ [Chthoniobacter sp.]